MATKFYFSNASGTDVTPAFNASWPTTAQAVRRKLRFNKSAPDTLTTGSTIDMTSLSTDAALDRQYISDALAAGLVLTGMTVTGQLQVREFNALDDVTHTVMLISVRQADGTIVPLATTQESASGTEFINNATCRNSTLPPLTLGTYTTLAGDRLIVEIGYRPEATGATPQAAAKWGSGNGTSTLTDLAVDETDTGSTSNPWIQFSGTITMAAKTQRDDNLHFWNATGDRQQAKPSDVAGVIAVLVAHGIVEP